MKQNNNKDLPLKIGGMATFRGVLLKDKNKQVVTSDIQGTIVTDIIINDNKNSKIYNIISAVPILRGIVGIYTSIKCGIPYIVESAENIVNDIIKKDEEKMLKINKFEILISFIISAVLFSVIWITLPMLVSLLLPYAKYRCIIQVLLKAVIFLLYIGTFKRIPYLSKLFEYHGAEHTAVNYYEDNINEVKNIKSILDVNIKKVATYSKIHRRCGSNYIMYVMYISLMLTCFIPSNNILLKIIIEILTFPLLLGIAYEILNIFSLLPKKLEFILKPFTYVQNITTKKPSEDKLKIAIVSLLEITTKHISLDDYIKSYIEKYLNDIEVNLNDILRLVAFLLETDKNLLYVNIKDTYLDIPIQIKIKDILDRYYINKEPLQYILQVQDFYNESYIVNSSVLIPRVDSEILVETAIKYIDKNSFKQCIDMCTGSGAIGISTAKNSNIDYMILVDISEKALEIASKNIIKNDIENKCSILHSNLFENIDNTIKYDLILSNPPYIKSDELINLSNYVLKEPMLALNGGKSGLDIYCNIFKEASSVLKDNGYIILEIGFNQKDDIINIIDQYAEYEYIECIKDLALKDRVIVCRFHQI
ncbi:MAG: peptide chain release factor N(5)-glutamine methyltransferase [Clostridia bacterium]